MPELLAAAGAGLQEGILPLAAEHCATKRTAQAQRQADQLQPGAFVRRAPGQNLKGEVQRFGRHTRQGAIFHARHLQAGAVLAGYFFLCHSQKALCDGHFVHSPC